MMKRATWFVGGVAAGAVGAGYAKRKVRVAAAQIAPSSVVRTAATSVKATGRTVADALREGRLAMRRHEEEARARQEGRLVSLADHVEPGDQVLVDGQPVASGRVIVMRHRSTS